MGETDARSFSGSLGPVAARRLRQIAEDLARLEQARIELLLTVAEAQGYSPPDGTRFSWDLAAEPPTWRASAPERSTAPDPA